MKKILLLLSLLLFQTAAASAQQKKVAETTALLGSGQGDNALSEAMGVGLEMGTSDTAQAQVKQIGKVYADEAGSTQKLADRIREVRKWQSPSAKRTEGKRLIEAGEKEAAANLRTAQWADRLGKTLEILDVAGALSRAAGHAYEGDKAGAIGVFMEEASKKAMVAGGAYAGSKVPYVGPVFGAGMAEIIHEQEVKKWIDERVDRVRVNEAMAEMLVSHIPRVIVMDDKGNTRILPADMYIEPGTGTVQRRNAEQQQAYERQCRDSARAARMEAEDPANARVMEAYQKFLDGKASYDDFTSVVHEASAESRRRKARKERMRTTEGEDDETGESASARPTPGAAKTPHDEDPDDEAVEKNFPQALKRFTGNILDHVSEIKVTATGEWDEDYGSTSGGKIINHTIISLTFWNVGAYVPGRGVVSGKISWRETVGGELAKGDDTFQGTFSGGPNGVFRLAEEKTLRLEEGKTITFGPGQVLRVKNPEAFRGWPPNAQ